MQRHTRAYPSLCLAAATAMIAAIATAATAEHEGSRFLTTTMIGGRAHMFDPNLNWLTFQHLDQMFATRPVPAPAETWEIPASDLTLGGDFTVGATTYDLDGALEATSTNALVVLKDGELVYETYRNGSDPSTRFITFSVAKSYVATLIGLAVSDGLIDSLDDPVTKYLPELAGSGYDGATVRDLLRMRSGVDWLEVYEFGSGTQLTQVHDASLVGYEYRWCDYARDQSVKSDTAPGARFNYATLDTSVLGCILESVVDGTGAEYMTERLWQPLGTEFDAYWIMDGPPGEGREFYGAGLAATARDHARFGQMILQGGLVDGQQVVPTAWVTEMTVPDEGFEPTEPGSDVGYQYQWWTFPNSNAFAAEGLFHQFIWISPDDGVVIVKATATQEPVGHDTENLELFAQIGARLADND